MALVAMALTMLDPVLVSQGPIYSTLSLNNHFPLLLLSYCFTAKFHCKISLYPSRRGILDKNANVIDSSIRSWATQVIMDSCIWFISVSLLFGYCCPIWVI